MILFLRSVKMTQLFQTGLEWVSHTQQQTVEVLFDIFTRLDTERLNIKKQITISSSFCPHVETSLSKILNITLRLMSRAPPIAVWVGEVLFFYTVYSMCSLRTKWKLINSYRPFLKNKNLITRQRMCTLCPIQPAPSLCLPCYLFDSQF